MEKGELHFYRARVRGRTCKRCNVIADAYFVVVSPRCELERIILARFIPDAERAGSALTVAVKVGYKRVPDKKEGEETLQPTVAFWYQVSQVSPNRVPKGWGVGPPKEWCPRRKLFFVSSPPNLTLNDACKKRTIQKFSISGKSDDADLQAYLSKQLPSARHRLRGSGPLF
ncbi:unnamed protein product [Larinioides sclopetarius]|uniref:Uncharacterized protein n=1 Tax=Larinioides sclopetarius TaxID=280406 RepID=A0AAV1ZZS6_9ARAC